jgi:hypothetical protein
VEKLKGGEGGLSLLGGCAAKMVKVFSRDGGISTTPANIPLIPIFPKLPLSPELQNQKLTYIEGDHFNHK